MLVAEAKWLGRQITTLDEGAFPLLNIGSQTESFRKYDQPWIEKYLFNPLFQRQVKVLHTDLREGQGVDLVGDLTSDAFLLQLHALGIRSVLCSNLLEHLSVREPLLQAIDRVLPPNGFLLLTCPYVFPYHPDPIDTLYRPSASDLAGLFPQYRVVASKDVRCGNLTTYIFAKLWGRPSGRPKVVTQDASGPKPVGLRPWQWLPWLVKPFYASCVVLQKPGRTPE
ncbi:MAG: methyltransferase type 11 [Gemmataceae bacterium]